MKHIFYSLLLVCSSTVAQAQCKELRKKVDKFDGRVTVNTPLVKGSQLEPVRYTRLIDKDGKATTYLRLTASAQLSAKRKGVYVLFSDGSKLEWPDEEVSFDYVSFAGHFCYSFVEVNETQLHELSSKLITDFKLYIYERSLNGKQAEKAKEFASCITTVEASEVKVEN